MAYCKEKSNKNKLDKPAVTQQQQNNLTKLKC